MNSSFLTVRNLSAAWDRLEVLHNLSLDLGRGEILSLLGPNGSGKTTLLRCVAGLERPTSGSVVLDGRRLDGVPTHRREVGLLFQEPALFPSRTVRENIAYGLFVRRLPREELTDRVASLLKLLHLEPLANRRPDQLSGGERQRVALARTLAPRPRLVLLDEPLSSVDPTVRAELRGEFRSALRDQGMTAIYVTHDLDEGLFLGDRVAILLDGRLRQVGTPSDVYAHPGNATTARFLGYNIVSDSGDGAAVHPRDVILEANPNGAGTVPATVLAVGIAGYERAVQLLLESGERVEARSPGAFPPVRDGDRVGVRWERSIRFRFEGPTP